MSVYSDITALSAPYLGPAAAQFISRQCALYLKTSRTLSPNSISRSWPSGLRSRAYASWMKHKAKELVGKIVKA
jgi:hypothetical protein